MYLRATSSVKPPVRSRTTANLLQGCEIVVVVELRVLDVGTCPR